MVEFIISGAPVEIATIAPGVVFPITGSVGVTVGTITVGTIENAPLVTVQGTVTTTGTISVGTILVSVGTVNVQGTVTAQGTVVVSTILNAPLVTVQGAVAVSQVASVVALGTIQNAPLVTVQGTVLAQGTVILGGGTIAYIGTIGTLLSQSNISDVGTVGTILAPVNVPSVGTIGTVLSPVTVATVQSPVAAAIQQQWSSTLVQTNAVLSTSGAATLQMGSLQDLIADYVTGTFLAGSMLPWIADVEEQTGFQTGTILAGSWLAGTVRGGHRLVASGALGRYVAVAWTLAAGGTVGAGTVTQVFITATPSESA